MNFPYKSTFFGLVSYYDPCFKNTVRQSIRMLMKFLAVSSQVLKALTAG